MDSQGCLIDFNRRKKNSHYNKTSLFPEEGSRVIKLWEISSNAEKKENFSIELKSPKAFVLIFFIIRLRFRFNFLSRNAGWRKEPTRKKKFQLNVLNGKLLHIRPKWSEREGKKICKQWNNSLMKNQREVHDSPKIFLPSLPLFFHVVDKLAGSGEILKLHWNLLAGEVSTRSLGM